jgi:pimeloyl-ACP methyl ester carboxylesterase
MMTKVMGMPAVLVAVMRLLPAWSKLKAVAHTLPYDVAITEDSALIMKRAATITVPTLVVGGEKSPRFLRLAVQAVVDVLPHAQRRLLEGQTHNVSAKKLAPVLMEFFAR